MSEYLMHDRSDSVVLDSRVWIINDGCEHLPYYNYNSPGQYYRLSSDMAAGLPREPISDWSDIVYCEFKIDRATDLSQWNDLRHWIAACAEFSMPRQLSVTLHDFAVDFESVFDTLSEIPVLPNTYIDLHDFTPRFPECTAPLDLQWLEQSVCSLGYLGSAVYQYK